MLQKLDRKYSTTFGMRNANLRISIDLVSQVLLTHLTSQLLHLQRQVSIKVT